MPEETETPTQTEPQAGETENPQPQAGETTTTDPQAGESQEQPTENISLEEARKLRSEAANLRKRLKEADTLKNELADLKKFKEQTEAEKLSETERRDLARQKLEQQIAEYQARENAHVQQLQDERNYRSLERAGRIAGIADPTALSDAIKLVDLAELEHDDSGNPTNADDVMKQLVKIRPWLIPQTNGRQPSTVGGATNPSRSQTQNANQAITEEFVGKLTPEIYASLSKEQRDKVQDVIQKRGRR